MTPTAARSPLLNFFDMIPHGMALTTPQFHVRTKENECHAIRHELGEDHYDIPCKIEYRSTHRVRSYFSAVKGKRCERGRSVDKAGGFC